MYEKGVIVWYDCTTKRPSLVCYVTSRSAFCRAARRSLTTAASCSSTRFCSVRATACAHPPMPAASASASADDSADRSSLHSQKGHRKSREQGSVGAMAEYAAFLKASTVECLGYTPSEQRAELGLQRRLLSEAGTRLPGRVHLHPRQAQAHSLSKGRIE